MSHEFVESDLAIIDLLRQDDRLTVTEMAEKLQVTATAVRQRLTRLLAQNCIERTSHKASRGRPSHEYRLTEKGRRRGGTNFADLAIAMWRELRAIPDAAVRQGLLGRLAKQMAALYAGQLRGQTLADKMGSVGELFGERRIPFSVQEANGLPVLTAMACPYPDLAEQDRTICAMERMMFSELFGETVRLSACRLDGDSVCQFQPSGALNTELQLVANQ